jgi:uncharacterized protein (DUF1778 family)
MSAIQNKQERLHLRIDIQAKRKIERAASYLHKTTSEFVLANALAAAETVLDEQQRIRLSESDWEQFMDALDHPPAANTCLIAALTAHDANVIQR